MSADAIVSDSGGRTGANPDLGARPSAAAGGTVDVEFGAFFRAEFGRVVRTVFLIVGSRARAEEIAQEAFVQLLGRWGKVSRYERPDAWVRRVAIRMATRSARREYLGRVMEERIARVAASPQPHERAGEVRWAVRQLAPGQRAAVVLFYFEDRPVEEVAELLGCAPATARSHLHKARRRLALLLNEGADDVA